MYHNKENNAINRQAYSVGTVEDCTEYIYYNYDLGLGSERKALILLLSMEERD